MDGYGGSSVTAALGMVYGKSVHTIYAIDAKSGKTRWKFCPYGTSGECIYSSPTIAEGQLFFGDRNGLFHCLDAKTGKQIWWANTSRAENNDVNATAVYHDGMIIVANNAGIAIAFEPATGRQVWRQRLDSPSIHELHIYNGQVIVQTVSSIYSLNPSDGGIVQRHNWRGETIVAFVTIGDNMIVSSRYKKSLAGGVEDYERENIVRCMRNGELLFKCTTSSDIPGVRTNNKGRLLYESSYDGLEIIKAATGECIHHIKSKRGSLQPGIVDVRQEHIYLLTENGALYSLRHP